MQLPRGKICNELFLCFRNNIQHTFTCGLVKSGEMVFCAQFSLYIYIFTHKHNSIHIIIYYLHNCFYVYLSISCRVCSSNILHPGDLGTRFLIFDIVTWRQHATKNPSASSMWCRKWRNQSNVVKFICSQIYWKLKNVL